MSVDSSSGARSSPASAACTSWACILSSPRNVWTDPIWSGKDSRYPFRTKFDQGMTGGKRTLRASWSAPTRSTIESMASATDS